MVTTSSRVVTLRQCVGNHKKNLQPAQSVIALQSDKMKKIEIKKVQESEAEELQKFKNLHFHNNNPIELAHPGNGFTVSNPELIKSFIKNGFSLKAVEVETSTLVGFVIGIPADPSLNVIEEMIATAHSQDRADMLKFVAYAEAKANIFVKFDVDHCLVIQNLCVHKNYRGHKIATRLLEACIAEVKASNKNFNLISIDCSNLYTAKIVEKLGMSRASSVSYDEYNDHIGKNLFTPIEQHNEISTYIMKLHDNHHNSNNQTQN